MKRQDIFLQYHDVIELYFLWSYYVETLCFASEADGAVLSLEYYHGMQEVCRTLCAAWRENPLIKRVSTGFFEAFESIDSTINTQKELDLLIEHISKSI
ncbi:MAG: hypothetical protein K6G12_05095 [Lachnospiraceae bacterium]|nr:hypothetical protein [Lachnospiraceae bacterium]